MQNKGSRPVQLSLFPTFTSKLESRSPQQSLHPHTALKSVLGHTTTMVGKHAPPVGDSHRLHCSLFAQVDTPPAPTQLI